jgi:hypothetical protein
MKSKQMFVPAGTLVAVFLSALLAWWIARWQLGAERRAQEGLTTIPRAQARLEGWLAFQKGSGG